MSKMNDPPTRSQSFWQSVKFALEGIGYVTRTQRNFQIHLLITLVVLFVGWFLELTQIDWILLLLLIGWVLTLECLNTGIEALADLACEGEFHRLAKIAKDISAGACLISAIISAIIGLLIFLPYLSRYYY